ncbi:MAG: hypothetical protein L6R37_006559 [Teloschistes peruensis]|nr:MAG: hypothetical protein L6R37_006559 [Teloschistes peruensis]
MIYALRYGYGRHIYFWPTEEERNQKARQWLKTLWVAQGLLFHTSTALAKYAILAFYYRIFDLRFFRRLLLWAGLLCMAYMTAVDLTILFECQPIHAAWDQAIGFKPSHCINAERFNIASGSVNIGLNAIVFALPIPLLWRLRVPIRQHIILTAIFTLAGFVVLVSIIGVVVLSRVKESEKDVTWIYISPGIWAALEPSLSVICACIPSLRPLFRLALHGFPKPSHCSLSKDKYLQNNSKRRTWPGSITKVSDGKFSQISEQQEDTTPFGHGVVVHGGDAEAGREGIELPEHGINVKTEVTVTTVGLEYRDRLY